MRRSLRILLVLAGTALAALAVRRAAAAPAISLAAAVQPATAPAGAEIVYTLTLSNAGDQDVQGMVVSATLPAGFAYVPGSTYLSVNGTSFGVQDPAIVDRNLAWSRLTLPAARMSSVYGMHTFVHDSCEGWYITRQLDWARQMAGPGSYVKQLLYRITSETPGPEACWVQFVNAAYDRDLIPVVRLQGGFAGPYWSKPPQDADGSYTGMAQAFKRVVAGLPRRDGRLLYVEVWNEPNLAIEWGGQPNPAEYGRFLVDVAAAIRSLGDPRIVTLNGGLSPGGEYDSLAFIDALAKVPGALQAFDVWASHPYPGNRPPEHNLHNGLAGDFPALSIDSYRRELARLAARGRGDLRVLLTETGYALYARDLLAYDPINDGNRADYISRAFRDYWSQWPEVLGVCPFELLDPQGAWYMWDWRYPSEQPRPQFDAVAGLAKSQTATPSRLTLSFRARALAAPGTYSASFSAMAGGTTLARANGVAAVSVQPGTPPPPPQPTPTPDPNGVDLLRNGSFEVDSDWQVLIGDRGGYTTAQARSGARSLWLGLPAGIDNAYAFSSAEQTVSPPSSRARTVLSFWYKPASDSPIGDQFKVLVRDSQGAFHTLGYLNLKVQGWTYVAFDTSAYDARAVRLTVVNDGFGGRTTVYFDDVSWTLTAFDHVLILPLVFRGRSLPASARVAAVGTPAPAATPAPVEPLGPLTVRSLAQPAGAGDFRALAVDPEDGMAYGIAEDGLWRFDPAGREPARRVRKGGGFQALAVDHEHQRLWVTDAGAGALLVLDLSNGREVARVRRLLRPGGLVLYGDRVFLAETDAAQVVVLDRTTCGIIKREPVSAGPYALAVDEARARIWVTSNTGSSVTALDARSGTPVGLVQLDGLGLPLGVAVDSRRARVYVTYTLTPRYHGLAVIDAETIRLERLLRGNLERPLLGAYGVAVEPRTGQVLLSDVDGLLAVNPDTLATTMVSAGHGFVPALGMAADPASGRVLAADARTARVQVLSPQ
jgi:uncharacterized repeat protein (TIGR01451 family)